MKVFLPAGLVLLLATPALAQTGNGAPSGPHYNLNIIGVENPKNSTLTDSNRHTIFVDLGKNGTVTSNIYLTPGEFEVCDGNAFDAAYDCQGTPLNKTGAVFQLPCNTNLSTTGTTFDLVPCDINETAAYTVWARALGKPGGHATMTTCVTDPDDPTQVICSAENVLLERFASKPIFKNVTNELTSLVANIDADPQLERVALFAGDLDGWFWQYQNTGLRLAQIRFYLLP